MPFVTRFRWSGQFSYCRVGPFPVHCIPAMSLGMSGQYVCLPFPEPTRTLEDEHTNTYLNHLRPRISSGNGSFFSRLYQRGDADVESCNHALAVPDADHDVLRMHASLVCYAIDPRGITPLVFSSSAHLE